jgi:hypothetical protein
LQDKLASISQALFEERTTQTEQVAGPVQEVQTRARPRREVLPFLEGKAMKIAFKRGAIEVNIK